MRGYNLSDKPKNVENYKMEYLIGDIKGLIEELNLKLTWNCTLLPSDYSMAANALGLNTQTVTISGVDKDGNDATNEISYLFLEAYKNIKALTSDLSIRIHKVTCRDEF